MTMSSNKLTPLVPLHGFPSLPPTWAALIEMPNGDKRALSEINTELGDCNHCLSEAMEGIDYEYLCPVLQVIDLATGVSAMEGFIEYHIVRGIEIHFREDADHGE